MNLEVNIMLFMNSRTTATLLWALMVVLIGAAVLMFVGQRTANILLWTTALSLTAVITTVLAAMYGFHHRYWSATVFAFLAFTQGLSARRKWTQRQAEANK